MHRRYLLSIMAFVACTAHGQSLSDAFTQGAALGRRGNAAARGQISGTTAPTTVPNYTPTPAQANYFGSPGLGTLSSQAVGACAGAGTAPAGSFTGQACTAVDFSQTNPARHPAFSISPTDPLLTRAKTINADPQAIAGNLAGTYSGCTVETVTSPAVLTTEICHQYRTLETATCDKILIVTPVQTPGCTPGQFLTRVTADPCPTCIDYLAYDFTCGANDYLMHVITIAKATGSVFQDLGSQYVPGSLNTQIAKTPGPSRIDGVFCYQTFYSQSCNGTSCSIGAWFANPCQGTSYAGVSSFVMPTTVSFVDSWDNQCAALEARAL